MFILINFFSYTNPQIIPKRHLFLITKKEKEVILLRAKENLTQLAVAEKLGISQAAVSKFERSALKKIRESHKIIKFANKYNIKVEEDEL